MSPVDLANFQYKDFSANHHYQADSQYNFICEVRCQLEQEDDELLLDWSGEIGVKSTGYGDPVTNGFGVIPILPSRFGVNVTAVYDSGDYSYAYPLDFGHYYVCGNGNKNYDPVYYGPTIYWNDDGNLDVYFRPPDGHSYFQFYQSTNLNLKNGDEMTVQLEIYEDKFYANYTVNGNTLRTNVMATFDGSTCGFDYCDVSGNYKQKEQY